MNKRKKILFGLFFLLLSSCTATRVSSKTQLLPTKSFVKILHTTEIISCKDNKDPKCPIGLYAQSGSGMAVDLFPNKMTVLTAGHVCNSEPAKFINKVEQFNYVIDHLNMKHQAWVINFSLNNDSGSGDLCLLWVPTLDVPKVLFSSSAPKVGDDLLYIGAPKGIYHPPTAPIFKGIYSGKIDASSAMVTFPAIGGSSGAAVLNKNSRIVGVVFAANREFHHVSLITTFRSLRSFLSQTKAKVKSLNNIQ
tara:strand:+ start:4072 stop:4821 length:750 start_codon:yes stop_codon:yes gene_type:complete